MGESVYGKKKKTGDKRVGERERKSGRKGERINEQDAMYSKPKLRWWSSDVEENDNMRRFGE